MDILSKINLDNGGLNDLYYVLIANNLSFSDLEQTSSNVSFVYPAPVTKLIVPNLSDTVEALTKTVTVVAYQSILDVCVQEYGTLDKLSILLADNNLTYDSFLNPGASLIIRTTDNTSKYTQTLKALAAKVMNYDRELPADRDIYLGTEDDYYLGPDTRTKIKIKL